MIWIITVTFCVLFVAYANGANDNFKGVATLFGSGTTDYRKALNWATVTTLSGSIAALFLATRLVKTFAGKGLVPDAVIGNPAFLAAVALGAGLTVLLAARFGIPISTTHGLTGALVGAGFIAIGKELGFNTLGKNFFIPLVASPFIALVLTTVIYFVMHKTRKTLGITRKSCLCVGEKVTPLSVSSPNRRFWSPPNASIGGPDLDPRLLLFRRRTDPSVFWRTGRDPQWIPAFAGMTPTKQISTFDILVDDRAVCEVKAIEIYEGKMFGVSAQSVLDFLHFVSAGAVSFARGLNDTPKIVALLVASGAVGLHWNIFFVAVLMALGGILGARKVAETVSHRITYMNHGQGFSANLVTAVLVIFASHWGMPVSTTHVSCGALFGIGLVSGKAQWKVISSILGAWFLTLPMAALFSAGSYFLFSQIGA